mmetsp:Transcript_39829/g.72870  ORF Transcript_39829/g.72870 Transcript_39829/m.72870 type:complete len:214 (-) Transcript_39829:630-1271(-)
MSWARSRPSGQASMMDPMGRELSDCAMGLFSSMGEPLLLTRRMVRRAGVVSGGSTNRRRGIFLLLSEEVDGVVGAGDATAAAVLAMAGSALSYRLRATTAATRTSSAAPDASSSSRMATSTNLSLHTLPSIFWKLWIGRASTSSWQMMKVGMGFPVMASWVGTEERTSCHEKLMVFCCCCSSLLVSPSASEEDCSPDSFSIFSSATSPSSSVN